MYIKRVKGECEDEAEGWRMKEEEGVRIQVLGVWRLVWNVCHIARTRVRVHVVYNEYLLLVLD